MRKFSHTFNSFVFSVLLSLCIFSCSEKTVTPDPTPTLYDRVGGTTKVNDPAAPGTQIEKGRLTLRNVVDSSIFVIAANPKLNVFFPQLLAEVGSGNLTGFARLSKNFTDFLCVATGSKNYTYTGLNMKDAHNPTKNPRNPMLIANADFDEFVAAIGIGLAQNGVTSTNNAQLVIDLVALLNTTRADVVQK